MTYVPPSLEDLLTQDFGLANPMPLQRAICRIADGVKLGDLQNHPDVLEAIGVLGFRKAVPNTMLLLCAVRVGKSLMAGAAGVRCGMTCDTGPCGPGDIPRVGILSTSKDEAKAILDHLLGAFRTSPRLASLLLKEPTGESIFFRHPTGRPIEIKVVAGARAGARLVARFMACAIFDECAKMIGAADGVVNLDDARHVVAARLLDTQCSHEWLTTSPWAPFGPVYEQVKTHWQHPSSEMVVVRARGNQMNPVWWTPDRIDKLQKSNPDAYKTDFMGEFADPDQALIAGVHIDAAVRKAPEPIDIIPIFGPGQIDPYEYAAEIDPATRGNAWTLVVTKMVGKKTIVCLAREWKGTKIKPLNSLTVLQEISVILKPYKIAQSQEGWARVGSDQLGIDMLRDLGRLTNLAIIEYPTTRANKNEGYIELARRFEQGEVEIPPHPNLIADLRRLRKVVTATSLYIDEPGTPDGRHCDFGQPLMRAAQRGTLQPKIPDVRPQWKIEQDEILKRAQKKYGKQPEKAWWAR